MSEFMGRKCPVKMRRVGLKDYKLVGSDEKTTPEYVWV